MLISLLSNLLISNALTLRKDKFILFSRIVMVSLVFLSVLFYLLTLIYFVYNFNSNPAYYLFSILILIYILPLICIILFYYKLEILLVLPLFSVNFILMLQCFNICFALSCLLVNYLDLLN